MTKSEHMSRAAERRRKREQAERFSTNEQILITQVVGSVMPDSQSELSMVEASFKVAAEFIEQNQGANAIDLTWEINGHHFTAQCFPPRDEQPMDIPAV
jgi:hypothetical protein